MFNQSDIEIWGGMESTINRVGDQYFDQSEYSGHYNREGDADLIASLGFKMFRYPVLWEKHQPAKDTTINWSFVERNLLRLKELEVEPIAGLVHHGSGPKYVNFFDGSFEEGVAAYAKLVAEKFPWLTYYTPINEPLTTARFCGLYGHWYPHEKNDYCFYKILLSECKATVMAMKAIREINPDAKLIQTEDLGKVYSTDLLKYQADFENERRWLSYELITGTLTPEKPMWKFLIGVGILEDELSYFLNNHCKPYIAGFNYYITSERYLDENLQKYPEHVHGGNGIHHYADVEVVRVAYPKETGLMVLIKEAWERLNLPIAITECHIHCTREEQMRWYADIWEVLNNLKTDGVDIRALTAWSMFGTFGWNTLVTKPWGTYESGVFNLRSGQPRPTAIARLIEVLAKHKIYYHPVLETPGWWKQEKRIIYADHQPFTIKNYKSVPNCQPLLILGSAEMLGTGFIKICEERNIHAIWLNQNDLKISDRGTIEKIIKDLNPWAIVDTEEYASVNQAIHSPKDNLHLNIKLPLLLAEICELHSVKLLTFSTEQVFDGKAKNPYKESDPTTPVSLYAQDKAALEKLLLQQHPQTLIIRTSNLFSPWDHTHFISTIISKLKQEHAVTVANNLTISMTYIPDLVQESLNLLLDNENGLFHIINYGQTTEADLTLRIAIMADFNISLIKEVTQKSAMNKALQSEKGVRLPDWESALEHYLEITDSVFQPEMLTV